MDAEPLQFRISSGLKDIIGKELITDDDIAVFELVKNSYDAYAKNVKIIFDNIIKSNKESKIIIIDDGKGMSKEEIVNKWLFVGFSEKKILNDGKDFRDKIKSKRIFAGAKGIGRFSSDRLGRYLTIYTKKQNESFINKLDLDWKQFEKDQTNDFQTIETNYSRIETLPKDIKSTIAFKQGTILEISLLHSKWDVDKLLKLKRYLQRLINPSTDQGNQDFSIGIEADEFKHEDRGKQNDYDRVNGIIKNFVFEKLGIKTAQITSRIEDDVIITKLVDKGDLIVEFKEDNPFKLLDNMVVNLFYLNQNAKTTFSKMMGVQPVRYGSIFLYRNGFRVYSYGDEGNDWLGLARRKAQGYARFLSDREMMGRIEILGIQPEFKELSSRSEGLVKNPVYFQLIDFFMEKVLKRFERYVVEGIAWDVEGKDIEESKESASETVLKIIGKEGLRDFHFGKNFLEILRERKSQQIPEIIKNFESLKKYVKSKEEKEYVSNQFRRLKNATKTLAKEREEFKQKYQVKEREALFLRKVVTFDKDQMLNLVHSVKIASQAIDNGIYKIDKKIKEKDTIESIIKFLDRINLDNQKILRIAKIITSANFDLRSDTINKDLVQYIAQYLEIGSDKDIQGLDMRTIGDDVEFMTEFQPIEISILFDNFISNAAKSDANLLTVLFEKNGRKLRILVGDNGKGISEHDQKFLFTRGFSTTKNGSGLGLYYNKMMIESMNGMIRYIGNDHPEMGSGACFEVILQ